MPKSAITRGTDIGASLNSKTFTAWKFDLLDAMARDPEVRPVDFHIAFILMQHVNQFTRVAVISDHRLQQLIHRDRKALTLARKRLASLGWLEIRTGRYGKATEYRFLDERAWKLENVRLDEQILAREQEDDSEAKTLRNKKPYNEVKTPQSNKSRSEEKSPHKTSGEKAPHSKPQWGENTSDSGVKTHLLHLQTPKDTLPSKGRVTTRVYDAQVRAYDLWGEFEETAGRLEYDEELLRPEAEHRARILCGIDDADGRQDAGTALPAEADRNPLEGIPDDQDYQYQNV